MIRTSPEYTAPAMGARGEPALIQSRPRRQPAAVRPIFTFSLIIPTALRALNAAWPTHFHSRS
ncbi:MAG: hypothetical protein ABSA48_13155 [Terracidiphilus sp.]